MIRDAPVLAEGLTCSDTLYIRGFPKSESNDGVLALLAVAATPVDVDLALREKSGQVWAKYANADDACRSLLVLHNRNVSGAVLSVKYELGVDASGKRRVDRGSHSTVIRSVARRKTGTSTTVIPRSTACGICHAPSGKLNKCLCEKVGAPGKRKSAELSHSSGVSYTASSLFIGDMEYPFPTGLYLSRVISLCNQQLTQNSGAVQDDSGRSDPLLHLVTNAKSMGNKYGKEISEAMAMVDAVQRAISLLPPALRTAVLQNNVTASGGDCPGSGARVAGTSVSNESAPAARGGPAVRVYVLGDGCQPLSAACLCLHLPKYFTYYSIDPLMREEHRCATTTALDGAPIAAANPAFGAYSNRFFPVALLSQEFILPPAPTVRPGGTALGSSPQSAVSVVVSCHSHAPLQEFWDRVSSPKIAVTMACCAGYADLPEDAPVLQFEDFEVYSPKRCVKIYTRL
jgi:hypothetical protein